MSREGCVCVWGFCLLFFFYFLFCFVLCLINDFSAPAVESAGQPSSSSSSHGIHRWVSGVWEYLVKPAGSHRTVGHQCTRTGEEAILTHMWLIKYRRVNILFCNKHSFIQSIKHHRLMISSDQYLFVDTPSYIKLLGGINNSSFYLIHMCLLLQNADLVIFTGWL